MLGPFRSELNPIGVMAAEFVVRQVLMQVGLGLRLVIVTPNPLTYVLMPLTELGRWLYSPRPQSPRSVRISHPSLVTRTVCSH